MVHVFIVFCHPSPDSFTSSLLNQFTSGLKEAGISYEISDLYKMNFSTEMSLSEFRRETSYNVNLPVPEDVLQEQEKLIKADWIGLYLSIHYGGVTVRRN